MIGSMSRTRAGAVLGAAALAWLFPGMAVADASIPPGAEITTYRSWGVGCDNVRVCQAVGASEETMGLWIVIGRGAGPLDAPEIEVGGAESEPASGSAAELVAADAQGAVTGRLSLRFDSTSQTWSQAPSKVRGLAAMRFVQALARARSLDLVAGGASVGPLRVDGAAAALRRMDDLQQRVGNRSALVATGPAPATATPSPPSPPMARRAAKVDQSSLPTETPEALLTRSDVQTCQEDFAPDEDTPWPGAEIARLGPDLYLWGFACGRGAYNFTSRFLLADAKGGKSRSPGLGVEGDELVNAGYYPDDLTLTAFSKGRGLADCGESRAYVWDGKVFQLTEIRRMDRCVGLGPDHWFTLYRAQVR